MTRKKTKNTTPTLEETVEAPPELSATQKLDTAIRAKAHSLVQTAIADLWRFVEKPEFDPEVLELLANKKIGKPPTLLEGALVGPLLGALDREMRSKIRPKPASILRTPTSLANPAVAPRANEAVTPTDPDLLVERLLKATTGGKK